MLYGEKEDTIIKKKIGKYVNSLQKMLKYIYKLV